MHAGIEVLLSQAIPFVILKDFMSEKLLSFFTLPVGANSMDLDQLHNLWHPGCDGIILQVALPEFCFGKAGIDGEPHATLHQHLQGIHSAFPSVA